MINTLTAKILLTSAGFETDVVREAFLEFAEKPPKGIKVIFVPTAAINVEAVKVLPLCIDDLLKSNIPAENIKIFDLHRSLSYEELSDFDAVYFAGGSSQYLMERINETRFNVPLNKFVNNGGVYVGVSAGSHVAAGNFPNSLGYLKASLRVHTETGMAAGIFNNDNISHIDLTDKNAVKIHKGIYEII